MAQARPAAFTLIELLVALAVLAVTASLAAAGYRAQLIRAGRSEAIQALLQAAAEQEKFHLLEGRYSDRLDGWPDGEPPALPVASLTPGGAWRLTVERADAATFLLSATVVDDSRQRADRECRWMAVDESGRRLATDAAGADATRRCWTG